MQHDLRVALCRSITARAHLAGAEAAELETKAKGIFWPDLHEQTVAASLAARRRYWREIAAKQQLLGHPWEKAEALGREV